MAKLAAQELARRHAEAAEPVTEGGQEETTDGKLEEMLKCDGCTEEYPTQDSVRFGTCQHPSGHCRVCLQDWLAVRISEAVRVSDIRCPCTTAGCEGHATY